MGYPVIVRSSRQSHDVSVQERLWTVSEQLTGVDYDAILPNSSTS